MIAAAVAMITVSMMTLLPLEISFKCGIIPIAQLEAKLIMTQAAITGFFFAGGTMMAMNIP